MRLLEAIIEGSLKGRSALRISGATKNTMLNDGFEMAMKWLPFNILHIVFACIEIYRIPTPIT